jgi:hypothetical protein
LGAIWRVNIPRTEPQGRKMRPVTDVTGTALGKRRNDCTLVGFSGRRALKREEGEMWRIDPLLVKDPETNKQTTAVAT